MNAPSPAVAAPVIELDGLVCRAGGRATLQLPRLVVRAGERLAVIGPNGAGKSTLLRVLAAALQPDEGRVRVLGLDLVPRPAPVALRAWRAQVGTVAQGLHLVGRLSARENVLIGALARVPGWRSWARRYPAAIEAEADAALARVGLGPLAATRADRLSGGERQKVAIARLALQRPRLVLADEPTAALDPSAAAEACGWLDAAAGDATRLVVVHQPALLPSLADRVLGLRDGRLLFDLPRAAVDGERLRLLYGPAEPAEPAAPGRAPHVPADQQPPGVAVEGLAPRPPRPRPACA